MNKRAIFFARWLYRWQLAQGIIGIVFSALTFVGVFTLLLGPWMAQLGLGSAATLVLLLSIVLVVVFGLGIFLDRVVRFWQAQTLIGTTRNPFLIDYLYQKEALGLANINVPLMSGVRELLADGGKHPELVALLDEKLERVQKTVNNKKWDIRPGEDVYYDGIS